MKTINLKLKRALSATLFVLLLNVAGMKNALAQNQVATLQHEGNISMFFGQDALSNAYNSAENGDTITLSSGNFNGLDIRKAIMIHGAGCVEDTIANLMPTTITSDLHINFSNDTIPLSFEGLLFTNIRHSNSNNVRFIKCNINNFREYWAGSSINNLQLVNCIIKNYYFKGFGATIVNSVVKLSRYEQTSVNNINNIYNSVILCNDDIHLNNSSIYNSIIATGANNSVTNTMFYNSIGIQTSDSLLFDGQVNNTNMTVDNYDDVFATFAGDVTYDNIYQLNSNIVNTFLGNDGTQVGIYGGIMPYNVRPTYQIIKTINVAGRTTGDDKLGVQIELNNPQ